MIETQKMRAGFMPSSGVICFGQCAGIFAVVICNPTGCLLNWGKTFHRIAPSWGEQAVNWGKGRRAPAVPKFRSLFHHRYIGTETVIKNAVKAERRSAATICPVTSEPTE